MWAASDEASAARKAKKEATCSTIPPICPPFQTANCVKGQMGLPRYRQPLENTTGMNIRIVSRVEQNRETIWAQPLVGVGAGRVFHPG
jgi:hypothetical protein